MKTKLLILGTLLISSTAFGQAKEGKSQSRPLPYSKEVKFTHGTEVSKVARDTRDGKTVSVVASSKNKGNQYGPDKVKKDKKVKIKHIKKTTRVQKRVRTHNPEIIRPEHPVRGPKR